MDQSYLSIEVDRNLTLEGSEVDSFRLGEINTSLCCGVEKDGVDRWVSLECTGTKSAWLFASVGYN